MLAIQLTAVEFYVREHQCIPCQPDGAPYRTCQQQGGSYCLAGNYFLGEDIYNGSNAQRDMGNPTVYHYNLLSIGTPNLHTNGGIQNKAFWLLAQNSTNTNASPYNQIAVTGIGRTKAEKISIVPLQVVT